MDDAPPFEFRKILARKNRPLVLTHHAELRATERKMENGLIQTDLRSGRIIAIRELDSENASERLSTSGSSGWTANRFDTSSL